MPQGAFAIVINDKHDKILLIRRRDFPIWDLPGGRVEKNESAETCAIRETSEESGYDIKIAKKVGVYNRPMKNDIQHTFLAEVIGGKEIVEGDETSKVKWFSLKWLPLLMVPHRKGQIKDYMNGSCNIEKELRDSKTFIKITKLIKRH